MNPISRNGPVATSYLLMDDKGDNPEQKRKETPTIHDPEILKKLIEIANVNLDHLTFLDLRGNTTPSVGNNNKGTSKVEGQ